MVLSLWPGFGAKQVRKKGQNTDPRSGSIDISSRPRSPYNLHGAAAGFSRGLIIELIEILGYIVPLLTQTPGIILDLSLMKFLSVVLAIVSVCLSSAAIAASVGFYAGTFDPPTQSEMRMIRCALGDADLHRACTEIGKQISRVVVLVSEGSEKETIASTRERILMLTKALENHADQVEIVAATTSQAEDKRRALLENNNIEQLFQLVSADSDKELQSSPGSRHPKVVWLTFPLEDGAASKGPVMDRLGRSGATEVIEKLGLYQDISADLADLQRSLFEESWRDFLKDLNSACPININQTACSDLASRWEAIPVVATGDSKKIGSQGVFSKDSADL